jgi:DNA primase
MGEWIDFKQLREKLDLGAVLKHYGVALKASPGGQHKSRCPLPTHPKDSTSLCFSANLKRKIWRCFGCNTSGNILDFAVRMEHGNPNNALDVRKVAIGLQQTFAPPVKQKPVMPQTQAARSPPPAPKTGQVLVNQPLDFALKNLSDDHDFFHKRQLSKSTIQHFGLGYCTKGMFAGRIAIPLHNGKGELIGYAGRLVDGFEVTPEQPLYMWPTERERLGNKLVFDRSAFLYHEHIFQAQVTDLVVVQSPESAWQVFQAGIQWVVALMGESPSVEQSETIIYLTQPTGRVWLLPDGNKVGERCAGELFYDIGQHRFCTWLTLQQGTPAEVSADELRAMLTWTGKT